MIADPAYDFLSPDGELIYIFISERVPPLASALLGNLNQPMYHRQIMGYVNI